MLRALSLALTLTLAGPAFAAVDETDNTVLAQQKPAPQTPKRDCERNTDGMS